MTVDGASYTVKSEAQWVNDDTGGTPSCGNSSNNSEYFHITSTVTSNIAGNRFPAVKIDSLVSPSVEYSQAHGTIGAKIVDGSGKGLAGVYVSGTGPSALASKPTDQNGCVLWRSVDVGAYTLTLNVSSYCDESGITNLTRQQTVSPNTVSFVNFTYDRVRVRPGQRPHPRAGDGLQQDVDARVQGPRDLRRQLQRLAEDMDPDCRDEREPVHAPATSSRIRPRRMGSSPASCQYQSPAKLGLTDYFANTNSGASITADPTKVNQPAYVFQPPLNLRIARDYAAGNLTAGTWTST